MKENFKIAIDFVKKLKKVRGILQIVLFGSVSKGEDKTDSDIDIAIIHNLKDIEKLIDAMKHHPINPESKDYKEFLKKHLEKVKTFQIKYPFLDFNSEKQFFQPQ